MAAIGPFNITPVTYSTLQQLYAACYPRQTAPDRVQIRSFAQWLQFTISAPQVQAVIMQDYNLADVLIISSASEAAITATRPKFDLSKPETPDVRLQQAVIIVATMLLQGSQKWKPEPHQLSVYAEILKRLDQTEVVVVHEMAHLEIRVYDLLKLAVRTWLNDEILNVAMALLEVGHIDSW